MRLLLAALAAVLLAAAPAVAARALDRDVVLDIDERGPVAVDVDRDGVEERLRSARQPDGFQFIPSLTYACGVEAVTRRLGPPQERNAVELISVRDGAGLPLVGVFGSSGATGRIQTTRIHRLKPAADPGGCPRLQTLFRFPHRTTKMPRPPRGTQPGSFSTTPFARKGKVWLRTFEGLYRRSDGGCCPSYTRTTRWRPVKGGYERAGTRVRRLGG